MMSEVSQGRFYSKAHLYDFQFCALTQWFSTGGPQKISRKAAGLKFILLALLLKYLNNSNGKPQ